MSLPVPNAHGIALPPRFEIRRLTTANEAMVVAAIGLVLLDAPPTLLLLPRFRPHRSALMLDMWRAARGKGAGLLDEGNSYAVLDREYVFKRADTVTKYGPDGHVYWDELSDADVADDSVGYQKLMDAIDSPLVSFALGADIVNARSHDMALAMRNVTPGDVSYRTAAGALDPRRGPWKPAQAGQVLARLGTATVRGYEGRGLMKALSTFYLLEARARGFRAINMSTVHPAVYRAWSCRPPPGVAVTLLYTADLKQLEFTIEGETARHLQAFADAEPRGFWHAWADLTVPEGEQPPVPPGMPGSAEWREAELQSVAKVDVASEA